MADNPLTKEAGGLKVWQWGGIGGGAYLIYRWWTNRQAASNAAAALGTTSGLPASGGTAVAATPATAASAGTLTQWVSQALGELAGQAPGYGNQQAYNDLNAFTQGGCVSATGARLISNLLANNSIGTPPGLGYLPALTVCAGNSTTGPGSPGTSSAAYLANQAAYREALSIYRQAVADKAAPGLLQQLYLQVIAAAARTNGQAGTPAARAAYDQALAEYRQASAGHASPTLLAQLADRVHQTQAAYAGHA